MLIFSGATKPAGGAKANNPAPEQTPTEARDEIADRVHALETNYKDFLSQGNFTYAVGNFNGLVLSSTAMVDGNGRVNNNERNKFHNQIDELMRALHQFDVNQVPPSSPDEKNKMDQNEQKKQAVAISKELAALKDIANAVPELREISPGLSAGIVKNDGDTWKTVIPEVVKTTVQRIENVPVPNGLAKADADTKLAQGAARNTQDHIDGVLGKITSILYGRGLFTRYKNDYVNLVQSELNNMDAAKKSMFDDKGAPQPAAVQNFYSALIHARAITDDMPKIQEFSDNWGKRAKLMGGELEVLEDVVQVITGIAPPQKQKVEPEKPKKQSGPTKQTPPAPKSGSGNKPKQLFIDPSQFPNFSVVDLGDTHVTPNTAQPLPALVAGAKGK